VTINSDSFICNSLSTSDLSTPLLTDAFTSLPPSALPSTLAFSGTTAAAALTYVETLPVPGTPLAAQHQYDA
jgi:hypothetical protein